MSCQLPGGCAHVRRNRLGVDRTRRLRARPDRQDGPRLPHPPLGSRVRRPRRPPAPARCAGRAACGAGTPRRPAGRPAAGGRPPGGAGPLQRHQGLARGRGRLGRQVRRRRRQGDRRVPAAAPHQLRTLTPFSEATRALRAVVRARDELVRQRVAAINQLTATLDAFWPGAKAIFPDVEREIALAFLERYPTPESAIHLGERRMAAFLTQHRYCGRTPAAELLARLRAAPAGLAGGAEATARRDAVLAFVGVLRALNQAIGDLDRSVIARLGEHPDSKVFASLPRSGQINAAQMLACWGDCRDAYAGP